MLSVAPWNWQLHGSYFVIAHFHYVLVGAIVFMVFAGIYYWFPKATGRMMDETLGKWHFWLFFIGFHLTFDTMHFLGFEGMPRWIYTYPADRGWQHSQSHRLHRGPDPGNRGAYFRLQPDPLIVQRQNRRKRSMGCMDARMGYDLTPACL